MPDASGFVPGMWERIFPVVRHTECKATSQSEEFGFEIGPVLQEAHKVWGRLYEDHVVREARSHYQMVVGEKFEVDMGKQGQIDFLGVGTGAEAWEAFAQEYPVQMCDATRGTLQGPHFLIAEIGLTSATLKKKFKDSARSLKLLQGFVSSLNATGIGAVKCLVYDGADAEDFAESEEGKQFMDEGGILMNIPYLTAETVLAKLEEPAKLREEIGKQREEIGKAREEIGKLREEIGKLSGATTCHAGIVWRILSCSIYSFECCVYRFFMSISDLLDIHIHWFIMYIHIDTVAGKHEAQHTLLLYTAFSFENDAFPCYWDLSPLQGTTGAQQTQAFWVQKLCKDHSFYAWFRNWFKLGQCFRS